MRAGRHSNRIIEITCTGAELIPVDKLQAFQGSLKTLDQKRYKKIRRAIERHGFSFPVFVWKSGEDHFIIDGHQRLFTVREMIRDGWELKDNLVPIDWIQAKTKKEAKEKILLAMSQYGKYDEESLYEFIEMEGLDLEGLKEEIDLPQVNLEKFEAGWGKDLPENEEVIRPFRRIHVLLSFHPDLIADIEPELKKILRTPGVEYEQCSN